MVETSTDTPSFQTLPMLPPLPVHDDDADIGTLLARADAHFAAQRMSDAMTQYLKVLDAHPHHAHALHRMGLGCVHTGAMDQACDYLEQALLAAPEVAELWEHAGLVAALKGRRASAEAFYHRAISLAGGTASMHRNLADCLRLSGRLVEAKVHYQKSSAIDPRMHHALRALAQISTALDQPDAAAAYWLRAWTLDPADAADGIALIVALAKARRHDEIDGIVMQMRATFAADADALKELSYALNGIDRFEAAIDVARQGLECDPPDSRTPRNALLHLNATYALGVLGRFAEMRAHSIEAVRLQPGNAHMQYNLATTQLRFGEFEAGWQRYPWRDRLPENRDQVRPDFAEWTGEPVAGRRLLLIGEQGLGDQIQFLRMADWLHRQGATVDVWVDVPLAEVARGASGVHAAWTRMPQGSYDYWCRMLRVPEHARLDVAALPVAMPYLSVSADKQRHWQQRIDAMTPAGARGNRGNRRIGLVWAGNPDYPFDRYRSIALAVFKPLFSLPGTRWFALQKGAHETQDAALARELDLTLLGPAIDDFTDTLAILQTLDLCITVDTSVAHLAGAAGVPVWTLLPTCTDWRWMIDRADSPWYPSMRLFRQRTLGDWTFVVDAVRNALLDHVARAE